MIGKLDSLRFTWKTRGRKTRQHKNGSTQGKPLLTPREHKY